MENSIYLISINWVFFFLFWWRNLDAESHLSVEIETICWKSQKVDYEIQNFFKSLDFFLNLSIFRISYPIIIPNY